MQKCCPKTKSKIIEQGKTFPFVVETSDIEESFQFKGLGSSRKSTVKTEGEPTPSASCASLFKAPNVGYGKGLNGCSYSRDTLTRNSCGNLNPSKSRDAFTHKTLG